MLTIREMKPSDLQRVAEIEKQIFSMPWSKKGFADSIKQDCTLFLTVEEDGEIVGYCGLLQSFDEAEITNVAVEEKSRGQGIAKRMLKELLRRGSERGIRVYTLEVRKGNVPARNLYEKLGFQELGIRKNFYERPVEDAVIMNFTETSFLHYV